MLHLYNPGERAPESTQYLIIGTDGFSTGIERRSWAGNPLPPTPRPGEKYLKLEPYLLW